MTVHGQVDVDRDAAAVEPLRKLCDDWERYTRRSDKDLAWRDQMRQAVVIEMRAELDELWVVAHGDHD
jgi:hypothetical protein